MADAMAADGPSARSAMVPGQDLQDAAWQEADLQRAQLQREIPGLRDSGYLARQVNRKVESRQVAETMTRALGRLSGELIARGYRATLIIRSGLWRPSLVVANPAVAVRTSEIIAESGWFWWPGARRVCDTRDPARAAQLIIHVLGDGPSCD